MSVASFFEKFAGHRQQRAQSAVASYRELVAAMPKLEDERAAPDNQIAAADRILDVAEKKHDETTRPLYARKREVDQALRDGSTAFTELVYSCEDPDLRRELQEFEAELQRLNERRRDLEN